MSTQNLLPAAQDALTGLAMFSQEYNSFQPIWYSVKEMGFAADVEQVQQMAGHILVIRKTRRHSDLDAATGLRVPECILHRLEPDYGLIQATGELRSCATCELNRWGSAVDDKGNQTRGKGCREKRLILFLRDGDALPVVVAAPPKSIRAVENFRNLMATRGKPLPLIHVTLSTERTVLNGNAFGVLKITANRELTPAEAQDLWGRVQGIQSQVHRWLSANASEIDKDDIEEAEQAAGGDSGEPVTGVGVAASGAGDGTDRF